MSEIDHFLSKVIFQAQPPVEGLSQTGVGKVVPNYEDILEVLGIQDMAPICSAPSVRRLFRRSRFSEITNENAGLRTLPAFKKRFLCLQARHQVCLQARHLSRPEPSYLLRQQTRYQRFLRHPNGVAKTVAAQLCWQWMWDDLGDWTDSSGGRAADAADVSFAGTKVLLSADTVGRPRKGTPVSSKQRHGDGVSQEPLLPVSVSGQDLCSFPRHSNYIKGWHVVGKKVGEGGR